MVEQPTTEKRVYSHEVHAFGGPWLRACRSWIQSHVIRGDTVIWGSGEPVTLTVRQLEEICAEAVAADRNAR